jgi:hypothetical protein
MLSVGERDRKHRIGIRALRGVVMTSKTRIALITMLLSSAACTAMDTQTEPTIPAQDQHAPRPHEHADQKHGEHHQHDHATAPVPSSGTGAQVWETDAPLREGMRNIRAAWRRLEAGRADGLSSSEARDFAAQIDTQVAFLIGNCKLQPQADAALHTIIADLVAAARSLQSQPAQVDALASMRAALQRYARQFDDPEWLSDRPDVAK